MPIQDDVNVDTTLSFDLHVAVDVQVGHLFNDGAEWSKCPSAPLSIPK